MDNNLISIKRVPGAAQVALNRPTGVGYEYPTIQIICFHPNNSSAFIFHKADESFTVVSLSTGEQKQMKAEIPKKVAAEEWIDFFSIIRASKLFVLALKRNNRKDYFINTFLLDADNNSIVFLKTNYIEQREFALDNAKLQYDDDGKLYFVSFSQLLNYSKTVYDIAQIDPDGFGNIAPIFLASHFTLEVNCVSVSINSGTIFFIADIPPEWSLLKIPLNTKKYIFYNEIKFGHDYRTLPFHGLPEYSFHSHETMWDTTIVIGGNLVHFSKGHKLFILLRDEECWREVFIEESEHRNTSLAEQMALYVGNGQICNYSRCDLPSCGANGHIYIIDAKQFLKRNDNENYRAEDDAGQKGISDSMNQKKALEEAELNRHQRKENEKKMKEESNRRRQEEAERLRKERTEARRNAEEQAEREKETKQRALKEEEAKRVLHAREMEEDKRQAAEIETERLRKERENEEIRPKAGQKMFDTAKNEIKRLKDMSHVHVIDYYGFKAEGDTITIFMEYMAAGSLKQIIDQCGPIKEAASMKYIEQILDALTYIHNNGIIHSDLKCDNLLHDGQGNVKLGDFGIAVQKTINSIDHSYFSHSIKGGGTCHWLAPEVQNGDGCSRRSDIWSLGCTIVEMLTGRPPYAKMAPRMFMGAMYNLLQGSPNELSFDLEELSPDSSVKMKNFLSHLLIIDAKKRPRSGAETMEIFKKIF